MLNALQLACITGLTGAEMETLLTEAGVTVTKGATLNGHRRKALAGEVIKNILTDNEYTTLRQYVFSQKTGIARQACIVWSLMEKFFSDNRIDSEIEVNPFSANDFEIDTAPKNYSLDKFDDTDDLNDDTDDLNDDTDDLNDDTDDLGTLDDEDLDDDPDDLGTLDDEDLDDDPDDLGAVTNEDVDDIDSLLNDSNNKPVSYDRTGLEADPDKKIFPDSEISINSNADPLNDLFG